MKNHLMEQALEDYFVSLLSDQKPLVDSSENTDESLAQSFIANEPVIEPIQHPVVGEYESKYEPELLPRAKPLERLLEQAEDKPYAEPEPEPKLEIPEVIPLLPSEIPEIEIEPEQETQLLETVQKEQQDIVESSEEIEHEVQAEPQIWHNIEVGSSFQALFFEVAGVTYAVPLTDLGGIHQITEITPLFGKPDWFAGMMVQREEKLNAVDMAKWVMPEQQFDLSYRYLVMLAGTPWGLCCERLLGTERLNQEDVKWRVSPGKRPWLAGLIKKRMCALLHAQELIYLLNQGLNMQGQ
ncbi:MAG: hypothetical protein CENE_00308 [Candidatus Celerinatantimonas neptuna]|nr:MAG: hypothetical protein CENE_00308 [Candidatus Celerinatantimonas neptuna]